MKRLITLTITLALICAFSGCDNNEEEPTAPAAGDISAALLHATDCKSFLNSTLIGEGSSSETAVLFSYDRASRVLSLTHVNAGFNCCPGALAIDASVEGNIITIVEREEQAACRCNCLFDLDLRISELPAAEWTIKVVEPYRDPADAELIFSIDLRTDTQGEHRIPRVHYPWGV